MAEIYEWQKPLAERALHSLWSNRFFINASTTGAGKTYICCETMRHLRMPHLVITPKIAITQWDRAAVDMGVRGWILDIINPQQLSKTTGCAWYTREGLWKIPRDTCVVFDEIHRGASGHKSITTKAVAQLKAFAGARLHAMSATCACSPLQMRALGYWAGFHDYNDASFYAWCRANGCRDVAIGRGLSSAGKSAFQFTKNQDEADRIMRKIRGTFGESFCGLSPEDIPGFPDQVIRTKLIDLRRQDRDEMNAAYASMSDRMKTKAQAALAETSRERERIEYIMSSALVNLVVASVEDGNSVVVFFNFTEPREHFTKLLYKAYPGEVACIYGGQKDTERQTGIDAFQNNRAHIAVVNIEAGGAGLSLHDASHTRPRESFLIPAYSAASVKQALGRIRRVNGTFATQNFVIAAGTIQERVKVSLDLKTKNIDALNDGDLFPVQP